MEPYILVRLSLLVGLGFCGVSMVYATIIGEEIGTLFSINGILLCYILLLAVRVQILEDKLNDKEE